MTIRTTWHAPRVTTPPLKGALSWNITIIHILTRTVIQLMKAIHIHILIMATRNPALTQIHTHHIRILMDMDILIITTTTMVTRRDPFGIYHKF